MYGGSFKGVEKHSDSTAGVGDVSGVNCGVHAGQSMPHVHVHVIPRYKGDMEDPRGGVRGVIPSKQKYEPLSQS